MDPGEAVARRSHWRAPLAVVSLLVFGVYSNSWHVPFLLDDEVTILANRSIRDIWDFHRVFQPPPHVFSAGRPLLNWTFALNFAVGGADVVGYHLINVLIHLLTGLVIADLVRRALELPQFQWASSRTPRTLALLAAGLWLLHPLQSGTVTYVLQRAETLMALFYLLTLYALLRAARSPTPGAWAVISVVACLLGVLTKETMVTAPVVALLFDRALLAGGFRAALRQRWPVYAGYAFAWLALAGLMIGQRVAARGVGFDHGVSALDYALAETRALTCYATLSVWPHPLVFDSGAEFLQGRALETAVAGVAVGAMIAAAVVCWRRSPAAGFLAIAGLLILSPTSSIVPIALQPMAENRMYLPLAAVVVLVVVVLYAAIGARRAVGLTLATAMPFAALSYCRNHDFRSAESIWTDTVAKRGGSARAHNNLGLVLQALPGRRPDAIAHFETALRLRPDFPEARNNLGMALAETPGRLTDAIAHYEAALRAKPSMAQAHVNLANAYLRMPDRRLEALAHYRIALELQPADGSIHTNLASVLGADPARRTDAIAEFETAVRLDPGNAAAHAGAARLLAQEPGRRAAAAGHYETALQLDPADAETHFNFANLLATDDASLARAIPHFEAALRLRPDLAPAYNNLAIALYRANRLDEAIALLERAQSSGAGSADAQNNLERLRAIKAR